MSLSRGVRDRKPSSDSRNWRISPTQTAASKSQIATGLNRAFVAKGLIAMRRRDHVGHTALMDVSRLNGPPEAWHLGFMLGRLRLERSQDFRPAT